MIIKEFCLAVQPGVIDFPARCALDVGHVSKAHRSVRYGPAFETITWSEVDENDNLTDRGPEERPTREDG